MKTVEFVCSDCHNTVTHVIKDGCGGTGYATISTGEKVCYACCAKRDRIEMIDTGRIVLYLQDNPGERTVTNWPGTLSFTVRHHRNGRHNIAGIREDVWFTGPDGKEWWGVCYGRDNQLCHCRRIGK